MTLIWKRFDKVASQALLFHYWTCRDVMPFSVLQVRTGGRMDWWAGAVPPSPDRMTVHWLGNGLKELRFVCWILIGVKAPKHIDQHLPSVSVELWFPAGRWSGV